MYVAMVMESRVSMLHMTSLLSSPLLVSQLLLLLRIFNLLSYKALLFALHRHFLIRMTTTKMTLMMTITSPIKNAVPVALLVSCLKGPMTFSVTK